MSPSCADGYRKRAQISPGFAVEGALIQGNAGIESIHEAVFPFVHEQNFPGLRNIRATFFYGIGCAIKSPA
jgi:hypothetical protein